MHKSGLLGKIAGMFVLAVFLFQIPVWASSGWGVHFVETNAPDLVANGHPKNDVRTKDFHIKEFETRDYKIELTMPVEHSDSGFYGDFVMRIEITSKKGDIIHFRIKKLSMRTGMGKELKGMMKHIGDPKIKNTVRVSEFVGKEFKPRFIMPHDFEIYYDISDREKSLRLDLSIELFGKSGQPQIFSKNIRLKKATFKR